MPALDVVHTLAGHSDTVAAVAVAPGGKRLATAGFDRTVKLWDAATGQLLRTLAGPQGHQGQVLAVAFSPDGTTLATGGADNTAKIWALPGWFGVAGDNPVKSLPHPNLVDAVAFDAAGTTLVTGCHDGQLRLFDVAKGAQTKAVPAHVQTQPQNVQHPVYTVAFTADYKQLVTASFDRSAKLWDATLNPVREFKPAPDKIDPANKEPLGHRDGVFCAAVSGDGKLLLTGSSDRGAKIWDTASGKVVRDLPNADLKPAYPHEPAPSHPGWVQAVCWADNDKLVVTAGPAPRYKGYIAVWAAADGKRLFAAEVDQGPVQAVAVLPGDRLVLGLGPNARGESKADALVIKLPRG